LASLAAAGGSLHRLSARRLLRNSGNVRGRPQASVFSKEEVVKIAIGFVLSFIIGAGYRYFESLRRVRP
jgi:hypothetical protein